jgi:hypothetical protein
MQRPLKILLFISLLTGIILIAGTGCCCPGFSQYQKLREMVPTGTVKGTVYAGEPKNPVAGAIVTIADQQTTTDAQGNFSIDEVVATNQTVNVVSGSLSWTGTANVIEDGEVILPEIILLEK